jgi:hypothetical protein
MRLTALILALLLAPLAAAHPLDDNAQLASEVVIVSDQRLEYVLDFRYVSVLASYTEVSGGITGQGLDANGDGMVTSAELKQRYNLLIDRLIFAVTFNVDGQQVSFEPDFERFLFADLNQPGVAPDLAGGQPLDTLRIHYRFVFWWEPQQPLAPGPHRLEHIFSGEQSVIHTPDQQMVAFDARVQPRRRISDVSYDQDGLPFPRLSFQWTVKPPTPEPQPVDTTPRITPPPEYVPPDQGSTPEGIAELPAWLTFTAGLCMLLFGIGSAARRAFLPAKDGRRLLGSMLVALAGAAIMLGALVRVGVITLF